MLSVPSRIAQIGTAVAAFILIMATSPASAEPQYFSGTGHWYEVIESDTTSSWTSARDQAGQLTYNGMTGHLATITSAAENAAVSSMLPSTGLPNLFWTGGYQDPSGAAPRDGWRWVTGERWGFTDWRPGMPEDATPSSADYLTTSGPSSQLPLGTWAPAINHDSGLQNYVVEYEIAALLPQVCYLDFSGYTAPAGYGSVEQIAADVKASVASKYTQQNLSFVTSFDGIAIDPSVTSTITLGGTNASPTVLGYAPYDPGNANRSDTGFVYTDQPLFTSMPTNSTEYKNMLANATAHETGHLLGYSHADAAGMPWMYSGQRASDQVCDAQEVGVFGEITQERKTYISNTNLITGAATAMPSVNFLRRVEMEMDKWEYAWDGFTEGIEQPVDDALKYAELGVCTYSDTMFFASLISDGTITWTTSTGICWAIQYIRDPSQPWEEIVTPGVSEIKFFTESDGLDLGSQTYTVQPVWDDEQNAFLFYLDDVPFEALENSSMGIFFAAEDAGVDTLRIRLLDRDDNLGVLGEKYIEMANVPEPASIGILAIGAVALLRRRRAA